jgi:hypothetical protein
MEMAENYVDHDHEAKQTLEILELEVLLCFMVVLELIRNELLKGILDEVGIVLVLDPIEFSI